MTVKKLVVVAVLITAAMQLSCRSSQNAHAPGAIHSDAPDFSLQDVAGRPLTLSGNRGKVVLLNFWATWCTPCRAEIPEFERFQNTYGPQGLQVIGVSAETRAGLDKLMARCW